MLNKLRSLKIVQSFLLLKGNTRLSVMFEPLWGIPFTIYNFYLSLYLKEMGVSEQQFGGIIAAGLLSAAFFSLFGGIITDYLGRKKTTFIFDFIAWPIAIFIYLISRSYLLFIVATVVNNTVKIVAVSWFLMIVEDADSEQRKSAFNLVNLINISLGIFTPIAGIFVANLGIIRAERMFLIFAIISMTVMIVFRNRKYTETKIGLQILEEHKGKKLSELLKKGLFRGAVGQVFRKKRLRMVFLLEILFKLTLPLGAFNSLYFIPYMTECVGIDKANASSLGGVYAGVMLIVFLVINPMLKERHISASILTGLTLQGVALIGITLISNGSLFFAILAVGLYALGYGIFIPFLNALFADVSDGKERAGYYSLAYTITSVLGAALGAASGFIYALDPRFIFYLTVFLIALCILSMLALLAYDKKHAIANEAFEDSREHENIA